MFEALITFVTTEHQDGHTYPVTKVVRIMFDTEQGYKNLIADLHSSAHESLGGRYSVAAIENLGA